MARIPPITQLRYPSVKPPNALDMTLDSSMRELALVQAVLPTRGVAHINRYLG